MKRFSHPRFLDFFNLAWLSALALSICAYMLSGDYLSTGYADWMYHAFRAQSLMQHGLLSWDSIWNNGLSYWQGYQMVPAVATAALATVAHITAAKAMVIWTVVLFVLLRLSVYASLRAMGQRPLVAVMGALLSFLFTGFWLELKDYSIAFAAVALPPLLALWHASLEHARWRLPFAAAIGLSLYIHPLLAAGLGGLWFMAHIVRTRQYRAIETLQELAVMIACGFFYIYGLLFADHSFVAPYQLTKDFAYIMFSAFQTGPFFILMLVVSGLAVAFRSAKFSLSFKLLYWFSLAVYLIILINHQTGLLDFLNRYQPMRLLYFIVLAVIMIFARTLVGALSQWKPRARQAVLAVVAGICIAQGIVDSSIYGSAPTSHVSDPVGELIEGRPLSGSIFLAGTTDVSYHHPDVRYVNGYNDQLLPQLVGTRYRDLMASNVPGTTTSDQSLALSDAYARLLGVQYILLPATAPQIPRLVDQLGYKNLGRLEDKDYNLTILTPPWTPSYATALTPEVAASLREIGLTSDYLPTETYYPQLDDTIRQLAAIKVASKQPAPTVSFPRPDAIDLKLATAPAAGATYTYLNQSFSRNWQIDHGTITRTADNMMLLEVPAGTDTVHLRHTWGAAPLWQLGLASFAIILIVVDQIRRRRHV